MEARESREPPRGWVALAADRCGLGGIGKEVVEAVGETCESEIRGFLCARGPVGGSFPEPLDRCGGNWCARGAGEGWCAGWVWRPWE